MNTPLEHITPVAEEPRKAVTEGLPSDEKFTVSKVSYEVSLDTSPVEVLTFPTAEKLAVQLQERRDHALGFISEANPDKYNSYNFNVKKQGEVGLDFYLLLMVMPILTPVF